MLPVKGIAFGVVRGMFLMPVGLWHCFLKIIFGFLRLFNVCWIYRKWERRRCGSRYALDSEGSAIYRPTLCSKISKYVRRDSKRQTQLLEWIRREIPDFQIDGFGSCWSDGIALCALLEALCPGACPRYDLLRNTHKMNNCGLAIKTAYKYLGIPTNIISAEDLSTFGMQYGSVIERLLSLVKWAAMLRSLKHNNWSREDRLLLPTYMGSHFNQYNGIMYCFASGCGLETALAGKVSKFDLNVPPNVLLDLTISIRGPSDISGQEEITTLFPKQRSVSADQSSKDIRAISRWKSSTAKLLTAKGRKAVTSKPFIDCPSIPESLKIEYNIIKEGHIAIRYIPPVEGEYNLVIKWNKQQFFGSPFDIKVVDTVETLNKLDADEQLPHRTPLDTNSNIQHISNVSNVDADEPKEDNEPQRTEPETLPCGITAAVLSRSSKIQRSISRKGVPSSGSLPRPTKVTRRRVLKRVITRGGKEIVVQESVSTFSRDSSVVSATSSFGQSDDSLDEINVSSAQFESEKTLTQHMEFIINDILQDVFEKANHACHQFVVNNTDTDKTHSPSCRSSNFKFQPYSLSQSTKSSDHTVVRHMHGDSSETSGKNSALNESTTTSLNNGADTSSNRTNIRTYSAFAPIAFNAGNSNHDGSGLSCTTQQQRQREYKQKWPSVHTPVDQYEPEEINNNPKTLEHANGNPAHIHIPNHGFVDAGTVHNEHEHHPVPAAQNRPMLKEMQRKQKLRMSSSLPILRRRNAFEIDDDADTLTAIEMEALAAAAQTPARRATLSSEKIRIQLADQPEYDEEKGSVNIKLTSPETFGKEEDNQPDTKVTQDGQYMDSNHRESPPPSISPIAHHGTSDEKGSTETHNMSQERLKLLMPLMQTHRPDGYWATHCPPGDIRMPTAKIDKWTQVCYDEIKKQTGWKRPVTFIRPRRIPGASMVSTCEQANQTVQTDDLQWHISDHSNNVSTDQSIGTTQTTSVPVSPHTPIARVPEHIDNTIINLDVQTSAESPALPSDISNMDHRYQAERQTTEGCATNLSSKFTRSPIVKFINGHRALARFAYRGKITLDPKLVSSNPCTPSPKGDEVKTPFALTTSPGRKRLFKTLKSRSSSDGKKSKGRLSENDSRNISRLGRGGFAKKKVGFCRRVMMYRLSSSRSSRTSGLSAEETPLPPIVHRENDFDRTVSYNESDTSSRLRGGGTPLSSFSFKHLEAATSPSSETDINQNDRKLQGSCESSSNDSLKDLDGFGVSAATRKDLLGEIDAFSRIGSETSRPGPNDVSWKRRMSAPERKLSQELVAESSGTKKKLTRSHSDTGYQLIMKDNSMLNLFDMDDLPIEDASEKVVSYLQKLAEITELDKEDDQLSNTSTEQLHLREQTLSPDGNVSVEEQCSMMDRNKDGDEISNPLDQAIAKLLDDLTCLQETDRNEKFDPGIPDIFKCNAYGSGLQFGTVGNKNMFQVHAPTRQKGTLMVGVMGPKPHTVLETSVTYTGDDIYEITYDVSHPGLYVINVKWGDFQITNSPFICQITL